MAHILDIQLMQDSLKDFEDVVFNRGNIKLYDLKTSVSLATPASVTLKRKIKNFHTFEILGICDTADRFVIHPDRRIQATKNGGTIKILRLEAGYKIDTHFTDTSKGPSGKFGVNIGGSGLNFTIDNTRSQEFKMEMGKLTHEHLVMIIDAILEKPNFYNTAYDKANITIEYLIISKENEKELTSAIQYAKMKRIMP
jgi:hypothetical protein